MPFLAIFAATAQNGVNIYAAALHKRNHVRQEVWFVRHVEAAVAVEQQRILAVELYAFLVRHEERSACAVLRGVEKHLRNVVLRAEREFRRRHKRALRCSHIVAVDGARRGVRRERVEEFLLSACAAHGCGAERGQRNLAESVALGVVHVKLVAVVLGILQYHAVVCGERHVLEHALALAHQLFPVGVARVAHVCHHESVLRRTGVCEYIHTVAHGLHRRIDIARVGAHLYELCVCLRHIAHVEVVAVVHARLGEVHHGLLLVHAHLVEAQRLRRVLIEQAVVTLRRAYAVVVYLLHGVLG